MGVRLLYFLVGALFILMNVLLWRTDITGDLELGSRISPRLVWEKVLTAAGESSLEIRHAGVKIGTARWQPNMSGAASAHPDSDLEFLEGMIEEVSSYFLEFDGNFSIDQATRFRFGLHLKLSTNYTWEEFSLRLTLRPEVWEIRAVAAEQTLHYRNEDESGAHERVFKLSELREPDKLLAELEQPWLPGALLTLGMPRNQRPNAKSAGLKWLARNDSIQVQHVRIRGYRLEARLMDRYFIRLFINPAGEVLRIELPGEVTLVNEALTNL